MSDERPAEEARNSPRYRFGDRWRITGSLKTRAPMHIGCGEITQRPGLLIENTPKPCEVQAVTLDWRKRPCIPGSAIKGVLRSWAEAVVPGQREAIIRLFGDPDVGLDTAQSGRAEFLTAFIDGPPPPTEHIPHWDGNRLTGVSSHVRMNRHTGAAEHGGLFFEEFVPSGVSFRLEIVAAGISESDVKFLLAVLERSSSHDIHPCQLGANGADGWGRITWELKEVTRVEKSSISLLSPPRLESLRDLQPTRLTLREPPHIALNLTLRFQGPFLVNDQSHARPEDAPEGDKRSNFTPLRHPDGTIWLPASSCRGALRQRMEFLLRSLDANATGDPASPLGDGPIDASSGAPLGPRD